MGIDRTLLERRLDELYAIGAEPDGGAYRPLYGAAWATAVERVERWLKDAGLKSRRDAVGNLWGRAEGTDKGKSIVTGSHIDTVRHGGRLDGALGIVAGLTAVEALLKEKGKPRRTLEVVAICEEEGSRFATSFWGSRAITGAIDTVDAEMLFELHEAGRVKLVEGDAQEILPGLTAYTGGKHTYASQYIGVRTAKGTIVVASDNAYLYENLDRHLAIAQTLDARSNLAAQDRMKTIASSPRLIVPGHDPAVFRRFKRVGQGVVTVE